MIRWRFGRWEDGGFPPREATEAWLCAEERRRLEPRSIASMTWYGRSSAGG
jgi:hypothetical protein